jgi:hypothetical protein
MATTRYRAHSDLRSAEAITAARTVDAKGDGDGDGVVGLDALPPAWLGRTAIQTDDDIGTANSEGGPGER